MGLSRLKMDNAPTVVAGGKAVFNLPLGYTFHQFQLMMAGTTFDQSHIDSIYLRMDGQIVQDLGSGATRQTLNLFNRKSNASDGVLIVDGERPGVHDPLARLRAIIGTGWKDAAGRPAPGEIKTLQLEVNIAATAVAPELELAAMVSASQPLGIVRRIIRNTYAVPVGDYQVADLPRGGVKYAKLDALYIKTANLTKCNIMVDRKLEQELDITGNEHDQVDGVRTPQAGWLIWDSTQQGFGNQELDLRNVQDLRLDIEASGAETIEIFAVYHGGLGR